MHRKGVLRCQGFVKTLGGKVLINDHSRGLDGYRFEPVADFDGNPHEYITDCCGLIDGKLIALEVDGKKGHNSPYSFNRDRNRDLRLEIPVVRFTIAKLRTIKDDEPFLQEIRQAL